MDKVVLALLLQLSLYFPQYEHPIELPQIYYIDYVELSTLCNTIKRIRGCAGITAHGYVIYLQKGFNTFSIVHKSFLAHELMHYVQWYNGERSDSIFNKECSENVAYQFEKLIRGISVFDKRRVRCED